MPQISAVFHQASSDTWCRSAGRSAGEIIPTTVPSSPTTTSVRPARRINSATSARGILSGTTSPGSTAFIAPATSPSPLRPVTRPTTPPEDTTGTAPAVHRTGSPGEDRDHHTHRHGDEEGRPPRRVTGGTGPHEHRPNGNPEPRGDRLGLPPAPTPAHEEGPPG